MVHRSPLGKFKLAFEFRVFWHRHTTGKLPECLSYTEYKRYNSTLNQSSNTLRDSGLLLSGPAWDNLALSQSLIVSKLSEIAVFEGRYVLISPNWKIIFFNMNYIK